MEASGSWRLEDLLVVAVFADLGVFVVLTTSDDPGFLRYLPAAVIFGTVLAGRWVGRLDTSFPSALLVRRGAAAVCLALVAAFAAAFGFTLAAPMPKQPYRPARQVPRGSPTGCRDWRLLECVDHHRGHQRRRDRAPCHHHPCRARGALPATVSSDLVHESVIRVPRLRHRQAVGRY